MRDLAFDHWDDLLYMVLQENDRQLEKWGYQTHDPFYWVVFLTEEVGELAAAVADKHWGRDGKTDGDVVEEAIQVATLALKIAEMHAFRRQSETLLVDPDPFEVKEAIENGKPGDTIVVEETIHPRFGAQFRQDREKIIEKVAEQMRGRLE